MFSTYDAELIVLSILVKSALIAFEGGDPRRPRYGKLRGFFMKIVIPTKSREGLRLRGRLSPEPRQPRARLL